MVLALVDLVIVFGGLGVAPLTIALARFTSTLALPYRPVPTCWGESKSRCTLLVLVGICDCSFVGPDWNCKCFCEDLVRSGPTALLRVTYTLALPYRPALTC